MQPVGGERVETPDRDLLRAVIARDSSALGRLFDPGLPEPAPGRTYELWFITSGDRKIPAGLFDVDAQGNAAAVIRVPPSVGAIALAAVTDEPAGGMPQPTGSIHLAGQVPPPDRQG